MIALLSLGLLASATMRLDHGLFAPWHPDDVFGCADGPPEKRIPEKIGEVIEIYDRLHAGEPPENVTERQLLEEFEGEIGFWRPEREDSYAEAFEPYALTALAIARIGDRGRAV